MRLGIATEELASSASALRGDADRVGILAAPFEEAAGAAGGWVVGRAQRAAQAFFDALAQASASAETGLRELGNRAAAGAGEYDGVEARLLSSP
jgi:hypothetical protein